MSWPLIKVGSPETMYHFSTIQLYISTLMVDCRGLLVFTVYQVSWFMAM